MGFAGGSEGKESTCTAGDLGSVPGLGRSPGEGHGNPLKYSCLENPHGERSLAGCSQWGPKELDTTEQLNTQEMGYKGYLQWSRRKEGPNKGSNGRRKNR